MNKPQIAGALTGARTPHKHAELIKAWADGAQIECMVRGGEKWQPAALPMWLADFDYRIKPEAVVFERCVWLSSLGKCVMTTPAGPQNANLKLTFEDGKLTDAKVI